MVLNTTNLSNSFYGKTSLKDTVFSVLIYGVKHFLIGLRNALMDSCLFSIRNKLIHFSLPLNPAIHWMGIPPNILCPRCRKQEESHPILYFIVSFSKLLWDIISELINLKYTFNIPFKITLKTIQVGTSFSFQFHDGAQLNILPTLSSKYYF